MSATVCARDLPSALARRGEIAARRKGKRLAVFLDYDGTLTPIVSRPDLATLSESMGEVLRGVAARHRVAVISGRDRRDVESLVGVEGLIYAGSHGFDIAGPEGLRLDHEEARRCLPALNAAGEALVSQLGSVGGALVERKRYSISVHFRNVAGPEIDRVARAVESIVSRHAELEKREGKKVHEIRPRLDWDKGRAVLWLLGALGLNEPDVLPFYIGDDLTDEDAFRCLAGRGIGIIVDPPARATSATYALVDPHEVERFLRDLGDGGAPGL